MSGVLFWCLNTAHVFQEANLVVRRCFRSTVSACNVQDHSNKAERGLKTLVQNSLAPSSSSHYC